MTTTRLWTSTGAISVMLICIAVPIAARAQCVNVNGASLCVPLVSNVSGGVSAVDVHRVPGGGVPPQRVALMQDGTAANQFTDGKQLATAAETSSLGQYSSYDLTVGNLPAGTVFRGNLHVVGYWGSRGLASAAFGASTQVASGGGAPSFNQTSYQNGRFNLSWSSGNDWTYYNIRWSSGTSVAPAANQSEVGSGRTSSYSVRPDGTGPYTFIVEGCGRYIKGVTASSCTAWSSPVTLYATPQPAPQAKSATFPHMSSGNCEMQNATLTFRSDGTGSFSAQVKTNHTHSGDVWHATMSGRNAGGQDVVNLPTYDSMRMDDNHGYYQWNLNFDYDPATFNQISQYDMNHSC